MFPLINSKYFDKAITSKIASQHAEKKYLIFKHSDIEISVWDLESNNLVKIANLYQSFYEQFKYNQFNQIIDFESFYLTKILIKTDDSVLRIFDIGLERWSNKFYTIYGDVKIKKVTHNKFFITTDDAIFLFHFPSLAIINILRFRGEEYKSRPMALDVLQNNDILIGKKNGKDILQIAFENKTIKQKFVGHLDFVKCIKVLSMKIFAKGAIDNSIKIWDIQENVCLKTLHHISYVMDFQQNIAGNLISCSYDGTIREWNIENFECIHLITDSGGLIENIKINKKQQIISSTYFVNANQESLSQIKIYNYDTGMCTKTIDLGEISDIYKRRCLSLVSSF